MFSKFILKDQFGFPVDLQKSYQSLREHGFSCLKGDFSKWQKGSTFSTHPENLKMEIEFLDQRVAIKIESWFFGQSVLDSVKAGYLEEVIGGHGQKKVYITWLPEFNLGNLADYVYRCFYPSLLVMFFCFIALWSFNAGVMERYLFQFSELQISGSEFLSDLEVKPTVENLFEVSGAWQAGFLLTFFGAGFGLGFFCVLVLQILRLNHVCSSYSLIVYLFLVILVTGMLWPQGYIGFKILCLPFTLILVFPVFYRLIKNQKVFFHEVAPYEK